VQHAQKTLDLQYYMLQDDDSGLALLEEILKAAGRDVRVRILIDDLNMRHARHALAILDSHPNIEVRGFNPVTTKQQPLLERFATWLGDFGRYTKRMHNKTLIADNQLAITGGRNLGDEYFDVDKDFHFSDLDVLTAGPVTADISHSFDDYWNSDKAYPRESLTLPKATEKEKADLRAKMRESRERIEQSIIGEALRKNELLEMLHSGEGLFTWAPGWLTVDSPQKIDRDSADTQSPPFHSLKELVDKAEHEFLAVSPYFVPREEGVAWLKELAARGLKIKILTNSLASTDVSLVHSGYERYREGVLEAGAELYELKPIPGVRTRSNLFKHTSRSSLHSKVYIVDERYVVLGSFNLDPRSVELNTEIAVVMDSPPLARQLKKMFGEITAPEASYRLFLEGDKLLWKTRDNQGNEQTYTKDPDPGAWRRFSTWLLGFIAPDGQL
jgi:cardiolipin synthase C